MKLGRQRSPEHHSGKFMRPYLRVANVYDARIDLSDVMEMNFTPQEFDTYRLMPGDVLLNEGQSLEWVGRAAIFKGEPKGACFQNTLVRFRAGPTVLPEFALLVFRHYLYSQRFRGIARWTTNIAHLGAERFAEVEFPVPPLSDQARIVSAADQQFTRLDAGVEALKRLQAHLRRYKAAVLKAAFEGHWERVALRTLLREPLRNGHSSPKATGGNGIRTLTLSAVTDGDFSDKNTKITSATPAKAEGLWLEPGDLLIERSNTPELVGTARVYRGPKNWAIFPDLLIRARLKLEVSDRFIEHFLASEFARSFFQTSAQGIAGSMPKISQPTIESLSVPLPPRAEQERIAKSIDERMSQTDAVREVASVTLARVSRLKAAILRAAFEGRLVRMARG